MSDRWRATRGSRAFSLGELLIVVAVTAILAAIAVPRFGSSIAIHRADAAAQRIVADLELARSRARMTSATVQILFNAAGNSYELVGLMDLDHSSENYVVSLAEEPYLARINSAVFDGDGEVLFDGYGAPDSSGTVVIQVGDEVRQVILDANTGRASWQ